MRKDIAYIQEPVNICVTLMNGRLALKLSEETSPVDFTSSRDGDLLEHVLCLST
jgi:hypothetical protein